MFSSTAEKLRPQVTIGIKEPESRTPDKAASLPFPLTMLCYKITLSARPLMMQQVAPGREQQYIVN